MSEEQNAENPEMQEFEVVELESEDGDVEDFVVIDRVELDGSKYAIMALLEDMENMEGMSEEEFREFYGEDDIFFLMRQDGEEYIEIDEEEFSTIKSSLNTAMSLKMTER